MNTDKKTKNVGVIIVTHTDYGTHLLKAAEVILGPQKACEAIGVDVAQEMDEILKNLREAVQRTDTGAGVLILTDMFGGTPTNLSLSLLGTGPLEVITGVNLPMLLKVLGTRSMDLKKLASEASNAGCQGIVVAGEILRRKVAEA
ncbi:PTS system mannose-specific IIA component [Desulfobaculum xiamenense]|uniref:PTS system mannose-specific IIA component n=1 Tax=Desulfobaculum xiamenense TaxID=995050 RepID=A0A846QI46_9BACT|nr:PTS sugar transporter subunit IIA [Desulfobaculum xiamenense]NJB66717.1 PTS system mannose-specific IIA component [Desulfobaculum xiamenense]